MILVADSGATKTDWRLIDTERKTSTALFSEGLNPYFLTSAEIEKIIRAKVLPFVARVDEIFFYGAGCGLPVKAAQVKRAIDEIFPTARGAMVTGDTLAAARSVLQHTSGIFCILGTGSNACVYDGEKITSTVPSLGYMFSDWGSGTVLGKDFLSLILQEKISPAIKADFQETFKLDRVRILESIYNRPMANRFMSSFTPFIYKHAEEPEVQTILQDNFRRFFEYYVLQYDEFLKFRKVSMVGSVAYHFKKYLLLEANQLGIEIDKVVKNPMEGLVQYHTNAVRNNTRATII
jgi:glucosamine kinase